MMNSKNMDVKVIPSEALNSDHRLLVMTRNKLTYGSERKMRTWKPIACRHGGVAVKV